MTPAGIQATTDDDGSVYVLPGTVPLNLAGELSRDWREDDLW
jgi:aminoglycoside 2'-N-acetyltransferase I